MDAARVGLVVTGPPSAVGAGLLPAKGLPSPVLSEVFLEGQGGLAADTPERGSESMDGVVFTYGEAGAANTGINIAADSGLLAKLEEELPVLQADIARAIFTTVTDLAAAVPETWVGPPAWPWAVAALAAAGCELARRQVMRPADQAVLLPPTLAGLPQTPPGGHHES